MAKWQELGFTDTQLPIDTKNLPDQPGAGFAPLPQPSDDLILVLPSYEVMEGAWDKVMSSSGEVYPLLVLADDARLTTLDGTRVRARFSALPRTVAGKTASDLHFLLVGGFGHTAPIPTAASLYQAVMSHAGSKFRARHGWTANCNSNANIYDENGEQISGKHGCGRRYADRGYKKRDGTEVFPIPQVEGKFAERFSCKCGAVLRAFSQFDNFRKA